MVARARDLLTTFAGADIEGVARGAATTVDARVLCAFAKALLGQVGAAQLEAHAAQLEASAARRGDLVCDAVAARALAAANAGDLGAATELARRASMMSRTEGLRDQEVVANLVLARVRRLTGRPFLATRILSAVARYAESEFTPWIDWELVMATGTMASPREGGAAASLRNALVAASVGDAGACARALRDAAAHVAALAGHETDVRAARALLEADDAGAALHPAVVDFRAGRCDEVPFGLLGLVAEHDDEARVVVLARPDRPAVRIFSLAARIAEVDGAARVRKSQRKHGRVDTALAALALAEAGISEEALFRAAYGFAFSHNVHAGVLDVLLHRARAQLGDTGEIVRRRGVLAFVPARPLLLADPRCSAPTDDRVLQLVAKHGHATAKDASAALDIPLRSAQAVLESLIASGCCTRERNGRAIEYRVDDTTFHEPTDVSRR